MVIFAASMTIEDVPVRFCSTTKCQKSDICSCGGNCLHTGMCCYDAVQENFERKQMVINSETIVSGYKVDFIRKRRVPYYVTECIKTFAGRL